MCFTDEAQAVRRYYSCMISIIMQFLIFFEFLFAIWGITALYKVTGMSRSVSTPHGCVLHRNGTHFNFSYSLYQSLYDYFIDHLLTSVVPATAMRVRSSDTSCGVKYSPLLLPALEAYMPMRYS